MERNHMMFPKNVWTVDYGDLVSDTVAEMKKVAHFSKLRPKIR